MHMENITVPMVFINAHDDPIIPESLLAWPKNYAGNNIILGSNTTWLNGTCYLVFKNIKFFNSCDGW